MNHQAALRLGDGLTSRGSRRAFARHFGEMVLAVFLGMVVLGGLASWPSAWPAAAWPITRAASRSCSWAST
jgi:hypothetical protein